MLGIMYSGILISMARIYWAPAWTLTQIMSAYVRHADAQRLD